jgi:hypothetical protein
MRRIVYVDIETYLIDIEAQRSLDIADRHGRCVSTSLRHSVELFSEFFF